MATATSSRAVISSRAVPCCAQIRGGPQGVQCSRNRELGRLTCWQHANLEKFVREQLVDAGDKMFSKVVFTGKEWMAPLRFQNEIPTFEVADSLYIQGSSSDEDDDDGDDDKDSDNGNLSGGEELSDSIPKVRFVAAAAATAAAAQRRHRLTAPLHTPAQVQENLNLLMCARDAISELTSSSGTTSGSAAAGERQQSRSRSRPRRLSPLRDLGSPLSSATSVDDGLDPPRSMCASPASTVNLLDTPLPANNHHYLSQFLNSRSRQTRE
ncbi:hypothetical protein BC567DRAFT_267593 [Phyllosticta citribraziliensis]